MACEFSEPVNYLGTPAGEGEFWNFKILTCDTPSSGPLTFELITNDSTGAEFFIEKTLSYGDLLLIIIISIGLIILISKLLWNFIFDV